MAAKRRADTCLGEFASQSSTEWSGRATKHRAQRTGSASRHTAPKAGDCNPRGNSGRAGSCKAKAGSGKAGTGLIPGALTADCGRRWWTRSRGAGLVCGPDHWHGASRGTRDNAEADPPARAGQDPRGKQTWPRRWAWSRTSCGRTTLGVGPERTHRCVPSESPARGCSLEGGRPVTARRRPLNTQGLAIRPHSCASERGPATGDAKMGLSEPKPYEASEKTHLGA